MEVQGTDLDGVYVLRPDVFNDERGWFSVVSNAQDKSALPLPEQWVQENESWSRRGVLRGMHFQKGIWGQQKLIRAVQGKIFDVVVDMRRTSRTFGKWFGAELSADNHLMLLAPRWCAHGFLAMEDSRVLYKCDSAWNKVAEGGLIWNDKDVGIEWPLVSNQLPLLSEKDRLWKGLREQES